MPAPIRLLRARRPARPAPGRPPSALAPFTSERLILHRLLATAGLPVPRLYGVIGPAGGHSALSGRPLPDVDAAAAFLEGEVPDAIALRPSEAADRAPARVLRREGDAFTDAAGVRVTPARLALELLRAPAALTMVLEALAAPGDGAPATRDLTSVVAADGRVTVYDGHGRTHSRHHRPRRGGAVPADAEAVALVAAAAPRLMPLRAVRWTVALTPGGPRLLEAGPAGAGGADR